jgi:hypothetical protein
MRLPLLTLPVAIAALAGCATNVSATGEAADAEASTTATAVVVVERTVSTAGAGESTRAEAVARFVRMRSGAVDDDALRMVGAAVDFPALGSCAQLPSLPSARGSAAPVRAIALVDVGAVTVESGGVKTSLVPRQLPDVADVVSGVVYAARPSDAALPPRGKYLLRAAGSAELDVAPFVVSAAAPGEPSELRIAGQDARAAAGVAIAASAPVELTWEAGAPDDSIYVDVAGAATTPALPTVRCLFTDSGRASIPAAAFGGIDDGALTVHRLHREAFHVRGVDPGEVRFDFARVVAISRR